MKKRLRILGMILSCVIVLSTFAACSSSNKPGTDSGTSTAAEVTKDTASPAPAESTKEEVKAGGKIDFLLTYPKEKVVLYELLDKFPEVSGVELNIMYMPLDDAKKQINVMVAGNSLPDVMDIDAITTAAYAEMGVCVDITDKVKAEIPLDQYYEGPLEFSQYNGKYYAMPFTTNNICLYYNKDMFDAAGLKEPPKNWDELYSYAEKLTKNGVYGFGMSGAKSGDTPFQWLPMFWQAGGSLDSFDSQAAVDALAFLKKFADKKLMSSEMVNWNAGDNANNFIAGKIAMIIDGPWRLASIEKGAQFKWDVAVLPEGPAGKATTLGGHNIAVTNSRNIEGSWALVKYFQDKDVMKAFGEAENYLPARKDVAAGSQYFNTGKIAVFQQMAEYAKPRGPLVKWPEIDVGMQEMIQSVVLGAKTPEAAVKDAAKLF